MIRSPLSLLLGPRISIIHEFKKPPYGGGNQFLLALKTEFAARGYDVGAHRIGPRTRAVLFNSFNFDMDWLRKRLVDRERRGIRTVHRVDGPISAYRGEDFHIDQAIFDINRVLSDVTVFQSEYSLEKHREIGLDFGADVAVIRNAVNPAIFHCNGRIPFPTQGERKVRVIATSWSPNRRKGADVYEWMDENLDFDRYEFTFVGNTPSTFRNVRVMPPVPSGELAAILRQQDIYVTASVNDPCSNALTEALACGLPAVFRKSGGHPEIVKQGGYGFDEAEEVLNLLDKVCANYTECQQRIAVPTIGEVADRYLELLGVTKEVGSHA